MLISEILKRIRPGDCQIIDKGEVKVATKKYCSADGLLITKGTLLNLIQSSRASEFQIMQDPKKHVGMVVLPKESKI